MKTQTFDSPYFWPESISKNVTQITFISECFLACFGFHNKPCFEQSDRRANFNS